MNLFIRFVYLSILILLDFIIYFIPILMLCLIPNLFITLFWFLPSSYQIYFYICTKKKYESLRIKIYSLLLFPIIIILYVPICILLSIGYGIFITLGTSLLTIKERPEYPFHLLSSTAAMFHLIY